MIYVYTIKCDYYLNNLLVLLWLICEYLGSPVHTTGTAC
jgi:hypothetical protein